MSVHTALLRRGYVPITQSVSQPMVRKMNSNKLSLVPGSLQGARDAQRKHSGLL